ncbi:hypothetical protein PPL_06152 [Heterostelium album PN500]|uniref:Uncharacterized protein n=1 Tax=Heterostelium pallidum (strain ATCC 26659 / Pp 5 / PN500) TaxID=670386 RepID=D3BCC7_HETP5|nr:hypothetical protein PPL_06152 [Heterostelium album PN500]EFA80917.1 hypothetical protein PPL_06152 [Heterostelium album PN500]|eukprot:XP_020433035.1 hypothetical protein PPL_06152 [Heterostelium album PN500]
MNKNISLITTICSFRVDLRIIQNTNSERVVANTLGIVSMNIHFSKNILSMVFAARECQAIISNTKEHMGDNANHNTPLFDHTTYNEIAKI